MMWGNREQVKVGSHDHTIRLYIPSQVTIGFNRTNGTSAGTSVVNDAGVGAGKGMDDHVDGVTDDDEQCEFEWSL
jgi:hypothetical protein